MASLWLDDVRERPPTFDLHAKTADEAIALLTTGSISSISFDHDLGSDKTGYDVACWIEKAVYEGRIAAPKWTVHSSNPAGSANIIRAMKRADEFEDRKKSGGVKELPEALPELSIDVLNELRLDREQLLRGLTMMSAHLRRKDHKLSLVDDEWTISGTAGYVVAKSPTMLDLIRQLSKIV